MVNGMDVKDWLSKFPTDCQEVLVNWMCMTDSNLVKYDDRPLMDRFRTPMPFDRPVQYNFPDNCHVKAIIKGGLNVVFGGNPHTPDTPLVAYNASGIRCENRPWQPIDYTIAHLRHFTTKTAEEYCNKLAKGTPDRTYDVFLQTYVGRFWGYNERTEEKVKFFQERGYSVV